MLLTNHALAARRAGWLTPTAANLAGITPRHPGDRACLPPCSLLRAPQPVAPVPPTPSLPAHSRFCRPPCPKNKHPLSNNQTQPLEPVGAKPIPKPQPESSVHPTPPAPPSQVHPGIPARLFNALSSDIKVLQGLSRYIKVLFFLRHPSPARLCQAQIAIPPVLSDYFGLFRTISDYFGTIREYSAGPTNSSKRSGPQVFQQELPDPVQHKPRKCHVPDILKTHPDIINCHKSGESCISMSVSAPNKIICHPSFMTF